MATISDSLRRRFGDVLGTEVAFICVPTPQSETGACDTSIVESVIGQLADARYDGVAVIKSTVPPGTTARLNLDHGMSIAFCPEFLRERSAYTDFVENHDVCGDRHALRPCVLPAIAAAHGPLPKSVVQMSPTEAELAKYFSNVFNALRVVFANEFFEVCKALGADYTVIKNAMVKQRTIEDVYLDCNERFRGFGGVCACPKIPPRSRRSRNPSAST